MEEIKTTSGGSYFKKDQTAIHTMPKRYLSSFKTSSTQAKSTGFLILAAGVVMLGVAFVFLYLYYSKPKEEVLINQNSVQNEVVNKISSAEKKTDNVEEKNDIKEEKSLASAKLDDLGDDMDNYSINRDSDLIQIATSSKPATSTEKIVISTSTKKIIIEPKATSSPIIYKTANDSDGDGLGDIEELLLDCNLGAPDSDGDGYNDLPELLSLYNPAGGGKIIVNPNIEKYVNQSYNYSLYYPNIWILKTAGGDEALLFQISTDQFIQIAIEPNAEGKTIEEWYKEQFGVNYIYDEQKIIKEGWLGIKNENGLVVYLKYPDSSNIFAISYNPGVEGVMNYKSIFDMMVNSLEIN